MRAGWTVSGACTSGSTAPPRGATRRASGGSATTSTTSAEPGRGCRWRNRGAIAFERHYISIPPPFFSGGGLGWGAAVQFCSSDVRQSLDGVVERMLLARRSQKHHPHPNPPPLFRPETSLTGVRRHG